MTQCVIISAGVVGDGLDIKAVISCGAFVICADGGYDTALRIGITPHLFVGDMDSVRMSPEGCEIMLSPAEKDDTDTMLAAKIAIERGYTDITIFGGLGGRLDHTLANIQT
ncbi:MAG: thiamine diphosphokinase, partial [Acetanaerobacterium sp.]